MPDAVAGDPYAISITAVIGPAPFSFSLSAGALPPGLSLAESGALAGVPTAPGNYTFAVVARDAAGRSSPQTFSLVVAQRFSPPLGIIGWWRAEPDQSGLARDQIAGRDGTFYRGASPASGADAPGKVGRAFGFDGALHIRVPDAAGLRPAQVSGEAWFYPVVYGGYQTILAKGSSSGFADTWWLGILPDGRPQFFSAHQNNGNNSLTGPGALPLNRWTHLAFTFDGSATVLYVNGVNVVQQAGLGPLVYDVGVPFTIGADWGPGRGDHVVYGRVDEVTLYGRALSAGEIVAIVAAGAAGKGRGRPVLGGAGPRGHRPGVFGELRLPDGGWADHVFAPFGRASAGPSSCVRWHPEWDHRDPRGVYVHGARHGRNGTWQDQITTLRVSSPLKPAGGDDLVVSRGEQRAGCRGRKPRHANRAVGYGPGKVGTAFALNGSADALRIPDAPSLQPAAITAETWVAAQNLGNVAVVMSKTWGDEQRGLVGALLFFRPPVCEHRRPDGLGGRLR